MKLLTLLIAADIGLYSQGKIHQLGYTYYSAFLQLKMQAL